MISFFFSVWIKEGSVKVLEQPINSEIFWPRERSPYAEKRKIKGYKEKRAPAEKLVRKTFPDNSKFGRTLINGKPVEIGVIRTS